MSLAAQIFLGLGLGIATGIFLGEITAPLKVVAEGGGVLIQAAMDLYFCSYNFVRFHRKLRMTPAMQAGVIGSPLTVQNLVEMAS